MKTYYAKVVGVTYENRQAIIATLKGNEPCRLVPEPSNPYDVNAIAVQVAKDGTIHHIGYIKKELAAQIAPYMEEEPLMCKIDEINGGFETSDGEIANYGVVLHIEVPEASDVT